MTARKLAVLLAAVLMATAACTYTGPPEDGRFEQADHGHPN